ncbi:MAG TPA: hypothetical protein VJY39_13565, partial [Acidisphaera sp.]|nr:hypothetical protein [Acidisphaera sp.]
MNPIQPALLGAVSGALAAAGIDLIPLGDSPPREFFLYPGLIFGLLFGALLVVRRRLRMAAAAAFATLSIIANAAAVDVAVRVLDPVGRWFGDESFIPVFALSGAIAGAFGGGLLGFGALRLLGATGWWRATASGAGLGLLLPLLLIRHA